MAKFLCQAMAYYLQEKKILKEKKVHTYLTHHHKQSTVGKYEYRLRQYLKPGRRCIIVRGWN